MLKEIINAALKKYEKNKGIFRKFFSFLGFGHASAVKALRKLDLSQANEFQVIQCFIKNMPKKSQESFKVYRAILLHLGIEFENDVNMLTSSLELLHRSKLLTEENFNAVKTRATFTDIARALMRLNDAHLLTQEYFNAVERHFPSRLATLLINLKTVGFLTQEYFSAVKEHKNPSSLAEAAQKLKDTDLLTQEYFNAVKEHKNPCSLAEAIQKLNNTDLLTQKYFNAVKEHKAPSDLAKALIAFHKGQLLTLENFGRLIHPQNNILLTLRIGRNIIWDCIPPHLLTQDIFEQLITRASLKNPAIEIERYINNFVLGDGINNAQSIHTSSIDNSVSTSAIKLWARYRAELSKDKIEKIFTTIKKDISNLPDTVKNKAAKSCIKRITNVKYIFTDSVSQITLRQLLALSYLAIHDNENRWGSREDAYKQFIEGLYEIQRGYNISANGVDDEQKDLPICTAGTFNKLMEKLSGIHPDVELLFITKNTAALKIPVIVREEVKNYLTKLSRPETSEGFHYFIKLLKQLFEEGIEIIWHKIKPQMANRLFNEFKSIYQESKENLDFLDLVDNGQYVELKDDLSRTHQQQMLSSSGYHKYCSQTLQSSIFFSLDKKDYLSNHCHDNSESQRKYNKKFDLVLKR